MTSLDSTMQERFTLAIDPGKRNMGIWLGKIDAETLAPTTFALLKVDVVGADVKKPPPLYDAAIDALVGLPWFPQRVAAMVVETQAPKNMPARIAATALYAFARGRGISVAFSGAKLKRDALEASAKKRGLELKPQPTKEQQPNAAKRRRQMHEVNKDNSTLVAAALLAGTEWGDLLSSATEPRKGKKKPDDMADALLLGIGACMQAAKKERASAMKEKKAKKV